MSRIKQIKRQVKILKNELRMLRTVKKLGLKEGVLFISPFSKNEMIVEEFVRVELDNIITSSTNGGNGSFLCYKGKWATIVKN